jgi:hypothetical protein
VEASIQEKVTASISKEKRNLQSPKKRFGEWGKCDKCYRCVSGKQRVKTSNYLSHYAPRVFHHFDKRASETSGIALPALL